MENSQSYTDKIRQFAKERIDALEASSAVLELDKRRDGIATALAQCAYFTGIKELNSAMIDLLVRFTMSHFSHFDGEKITLAFELATAGKLECDPDHYGTFNGVYISKIYSAYEKLEQRYTAEYKKKREAKFLAEQSKNIDPIEVAKNWAPTICEYAIQAAAMEKLDYDLLWPDESVKFLAGNVMYQYFINVGIFDQEHAEKSGKGYAGGRWIACDRFWTEVS